jgi:hypothetical protein
MYFLNISLKQAVFENGRVRGRGKEGKSSQHLIVALPHGFYEFVRERGLGKRNFGC